MLIPPARAAILERMAEGVARRQDELGKLIQLESGKPITYARLEVTRCVDTRRAAATRRRRT